MRWTVAAIGTSILIHALLYWWLAGRELRPPPPPETIVLELREPPPEGSAEPTGDPRGTKVKREKALWHALKRPFDMNGAIASAERAQNADARGSSEWSNEHWGVRGGTLKEIEHFISYDKLLQEIQGILVYPGALGLRSISGTINARVYFTKDSRCDRKRTWATGHHHYLRFYVLAVLKKVCSLESVQHMGFTENQFVDMSFAFTLTQGEARLESEKRDKILGNVMRFERIHHQVWYEWKLGPFRGIYGVPAVALDFPWVLDKWEKWVEGRDPLDAFRE